MRIAIAFAILLASAVPAYANDWEKFYTAITGFGELIDATTDPEQLPSQGSIDADVDAMWRKGFAPIGYTYFNASNTKTKDGLKLAKKLKARFIVVGVQYTGTNAGSIPITTPTINTTYSNGSVSANGSGGYVAGNYSGTSTTYGSTTTNIPYSVNRYDKFGIYFKEMPKHGIGVMYRELEPAEVTQLETRRAVAIISIRDGSPAYQADMLPGDIITSVNGEPADVETWRRAMTGAVEAKITFVRNGTTRELTIPIPPEWRN